eukprot:10299048-Ditylum_brightwellii.AAC.1
MDIVSIVDSSFGQFAESSFGKLTTGSGLEPDRLRWLEPESCAGDRSVTKEEILVMVHCYQGYKEYCLVFWQPIEREDKGTNVAEAEEEWAFFLAEQMLCFGCFVKTAVCVLCERRRDTAQSTQREEEQNLDSAEVCVE